MITSRRFSYRWAAFLIGACLLGLATLFFFMSRRAAETNPLFSDAVVLPQGAADEIADFPNGDYTVNDGFSTHLPLVVIDTDGQELLENAVWDSESYTYVAVEDPNTAFTRCHFTLYDSGSMNSPADQPTATSYADIRYRGNSSLHYEKKQYLVKLVDDANEVRDMDLLGMGADNSWILNGSSIDKSMMRNYVAYTLAGEIFENAVEAKYCEVLFQNEDGTYEYMGVYLLTESVKRGDARINIPKFDPHYAATSYILRRDRYDKWALNLDLFTRQQGLTYGVLSVKYPGNDEITEDAVDYIEEDIATFERELYSDDANTYIAYRDFIDTESFVDYFLFNEFFVNYDAGNNSTYVYKELGGKLKAGPAWDFDGAMDNYYGAPYDYDAIAFQEAPWFDRMMLDPEFCAKLIERYKELRQGALSDKTVDALIDQTVAYLGNAQAREWSRWEAQYVDSDYLQDGTDRHGVLHTNRNMNTFEEEVQKIKTVLRDHGQWLDEHTGTFYMKTNTVSKLTAQKLAAAEAQQSLIKNYRSLAAVLFIAVFLIAIILVQRS